jgi:hypothetical protein
VAWYLELTKYYIDRDRSLLQLVIHLAELGINVRKFTDLRTIGILLARFAASRDRSNEV